MKGAWSALRDLFKFLGTCLIFGTDEAKHFEFGRPVQVNHRALESRCCMTRWRRVHSIATEMNRNEMTSSVQFNSAMWTDLKLCNLVGGRSSGEMSLWALLCSSYAVCTTIGLELNDKMASATCLTRANISTDYRQWSIPLIKSTRISTKNKCRFWHGDRHRDELDDRWSYTYDWMLCSLSWCMDQYSRSFCQIRVVKQRPGAVSYTHLTLPTIYSV